VPVASAGRINVEKGKNNKFTPFISYTKFENEPSWFNDVFLEISQFEPISLWSLTNTFVEYS
jgi:hypothetical protein